jgi:Skp family chaperone for outer membrane proteins
MMKNQQRFIPELFGALLLVGVISTATTGSSNSDKLGPIESLTIQGEEEELTISNSDGRISWSDQKTSTVWSVGFMEVGKALSQLMKAEHFLDARESLDDELQETMSSARSNLDSLREEGQSLQPDDPSVPEMRQRWDRTYAEFQRLQKIAAEARARLLAEQMESSYTEIVEAVNVVSERLEIDIVLKFIPPDGEFNLGNPDSMLSQIRLRTALRVPEGIDITDEVLAELGLDAQ